MIRVKFIKWYPFEDERLFDIKWDEEQLYDYYMDWMETVSNIISLGFYVGIHKNKNGLIVIAIDTTWFKQR